MPRGVRPTILKSWGIATSPPGAFCFISPGVLARRGPLSCCSWRVLLGAWSSRNLRQEHGRSIPLADVQRKNTYFTRAAITNATTHEGNQSADADVPHPAVCAISAAFASDSDFETFHAFIVAASVHQQQPEETIAAFVIAHRELLNARPSAFISVSLSAVLEEGQTEAQKYVDGFVFVTAWQPRMPLRGRSSVPRQLRQASLRTP